MTSIECEQTLIVLLACRRVQGAAIAERIAMMSARLDLAARRERRASQQLFEGGDLGERHMAVVLGKGVVALGPDVAQYQMWRVRLVGDQSRAVVRREAGNAVAMSSGGDRDES